jgi:hypothetical protein
MRMLPWPMHRVHALMGVRCPQAYVVVLGYSLIRTDQLPPATELKTLIDTPDLKGAIADQLADAGFVTEEQLGRLQVCACHSLLLRNHEVHLAASACACGVLNQWLACAG